MPRYELTRCAVCGSAEARTIASADEIRAEAELLWAFHMRRLSPATPPERLVDRVAFSQDPPWRVVQCTECELVYRNPAERPQSLRAAYANPEQDRDALLTLHASQLPAARAFARRLARATGHDAATMRGLEVGSYVGAFLAAARERRWRFEGLDVNPVVNEVTRSLGFNVHDGDLESFRPDGSAEFGALAIWNTFDQLPDPGAALRSVQRLLAPSGVLAIRVPNGGCYARWHARSARGGGVTGAFATALLAHNNLLTFPYRFGFTPRSLGRLLESCGFRVMRVVGDSLVPTSDEWTRPWAALESRAFKRLTRRAMPWFETYASQTPAPAR